MSELKRQPNFDCSQLVSFRASGTEKHHFLGLDLFAANGFNVLQDSDVKDVKKKYFRTYDDEFFIELDDKLFIGELEDWVDLSRPPVRVADFVESILNFIRLNNLPSLSVFISVFAEQGRTSNYVMEISPCDMLKSLYSMSQSNFDVWVDNLTLRLVT